MITRRIRSELLLLVGSLCVPGVIAHAGDTFVTPPWNHCLGLHKVTQFHLNLYSGYRETFNDPQGLFCVKLESEDDPESEKDDDELTVFGLNRGADQLIYNRGLTSIRIVSEVGLGFGRLKRPNAVTGDRAGNIYVADTGNNRILHLSYREGELVPVREIVGDSLSNPYGVVLSGGFLYVTDTGHHRIVVFDTNGSVAGTLTPSTEAGRLRAPTAIAAVSAGDEWVHYEDFFLAVVDSSGGRLWKVGTDGSALGLVEYSTLGGDGGFGHVAIDYYGNVYVTDRPAARVHKFSKALDYIIAIGGDDEQFDEPRGITVNRRFGQVFVSERAGAQYFWIGTDILRLEADRISFDVERKLCTVACSFLLTEHAALSLILSDERGRDRFALVDGYTVPLGRFARELTVRCADAEALAKCKLRLVAVAKPTYSSSQFLTVRKETRLIEATVNEY